MGQLRGFSKEVKFILAVGFVFIFFLLINLYTAVFFGDDMSYRFMWQEGTGLHHKLLYNAPRVSSLEDVLWSVKNHYLYWHGRVTAVFLMFFFGWQDKAVFNVCNAVVSTALVVLIVYYSRLGCKEKLPGWKELVGVVCLIWFFIIPFTGVFLWMAGSLSYLWPMVLALLFLLPYSWVWYEDKNFSMDSKKASVGMFFFGVLLGMTNENHIGALFCVLSFMCFYFYKKKVLRTWMWTGVVGLLAGFLIMMLSPSIPIRVRSEFQYSYDKLLYLIQIGEISYDEGKEVLQDLKNILQQDSISFFCWVKPKIIIDNIIGLAFNILPFGFLLSYLLVNVRKYINDKEKVFIYGLLLISVLSFLVLLLSPYLLIRQLFFTYVYFFIVFLMVLRCFLEEYVGWRKATKGLIVLFFVYCFAGQVSYLYDLRTACHKREVMDAFLMERQGTKVTYNIEKPSLPWYRHTPGLIELDMFKNGIPYRDDWVLASMRAYYRIPELIIYVSRERRER